MTIRPAVLASALLVLPVALSAQGTSAAGTATIKIDGFDFTVAGDYPATICGGALPGGNGMAYQASAAEYEITIASESRSTGTVPLNTKDGKAVNVSVTIIGKGQNLVRRPPNGGKLIVSDDFKKAVAALELPAAGRGTTNLRATFVCR